MIKSTYQSKSNTKSQKSESKSQKPAVKSQKHRRGNNPASQDETLGSVHNEITNDSLDDNNATFSFNFRSHEEKNSKHMIDNKTRDVDPVHHRDNQYDKSSTESKYMPTWTEVVI